PFSVPLSSNSNGAYGMSEHTVSLPGDTVFRAAPWAVMSRGADVRLLRPPMAPPLSFPPQLATRSPAATNSAARRPGCDEAVLTGSPFYKSVPCVWRRRDPHGRCSMKIQVRRWIEVGPHARRAILWRGQG